MVTIYLHQYQEFLYIQPEMKFFLSSPSLFSLIHLLMIIMSLMSRLSFKHFNYYLLIPLPTYIQSVFITSFSSIFASLTINLGRTFITFIPRVQWQPHCFPCLFSVVDPVQHSCCYHIHLLTTISLVFLLSISSDLKCFTIYLYLMYLHCVTSFTFFTSVSTALPFPPLYSLPLCQSKSWSVFKVQPSCHPEMLFLSFEFVLYCFTGQTLLWDTHFTLCFAFLLLLKCFLLSSVCFKFCLPCGQL